MSKRDDEQRVSLTEAARIADRSTQQIIAAVRDGELREFPGRKYSLNELNALGPRPTIRQFRRRIAR